MLYGIGTESDLFAMESAAEIALKSRPEHQEHYSIGERCKAAADGYSFYGVPVPFDPTEKGYLRLIGYMHGAGQEAFDAFMRLMEGKNISKGGQAFIDQTLAGAARGNIKDRDNCPFICDLIMKVLLSSDQNYNMMEAPSIIQ